MVIHKNIFIADDDEDDRYLFINALNELDQNISCEFAIDGKDVLAKLKHIDQLPDVLFLDLNMPKLNGFECLKKIKNDIRMVNLPIVIFTTSQNPSDIELTYNLGANVFFTKPNDYNELKNKLRRILNLNFLPDNRRLDVTMQYVV